MKNLNNAYMAEMSQTEMQEINGGLFPIVIFGVAISAKAAAAALAAGIFAAGCYVGYKEAANQ